MTRDAFRSKVETDLRSMGYGPREYVWASPSKLIVLVGREMREVNLHANMGIARRERVLGRIEGWRETVNMGNGKEAA